MDIERKIISRRQFLIGAGFSLIAAGCKRVEKKLPVIIMEPSVTLEPTQPPTEELAETPVPSQIPTKTPTKTLILTSTFEPTPTFTVSSTPELTATPTLEPTPERPEWLPQVSNTEVRYNQEEERWEYYTLQGEYLVSVKENPSGYEFFSFADEVSPGQHPELFAKSTWEEIRQGTTL